jgi:arylformamidase
LFSVRLTTHDSRLRSVFDLTQPLTSLIPRFPGDPEVRIEALPGMAPWRVSALAMGTHSGTHIDAPRHRIAGGAGVGEYGPERLVGRGLVVEAAGFGENEAIPASVLDPLRGQVWPGWFAVVRTGWDRFWGDARYFRHPYLSAALAGALVALDAGLVAIDALSVDSTVDASSEAHLSLLGADVLIAENLRNLSMLAADRPFAFAALPLALDGADGSPARVVAWEPGSLGI